MLVVGFPLERNFTSSSDSSGSMLTNSGSVRLGLVVGVPVAYLEVLFCLLGKCLVLGLGIMQGVLAVV